MGQARKKPQSIIERVASSEEIDFERASDELKFKVYKLTLREIEQMLRAEKIAKASLVEIRTALNDVNNGFLDLRARPNKVNKKYINTVTDNFIEARAYLRFALTELETKGRGKTVDYELALGKGLNLISKINQDLLDPSDLP